MPSRARVRDYAAEYARRQARAREAGYDSYHAQRVAQGRARGLTTTQAAGHPRRSELGARAATRLRTQVQGATSVSAHVVGKRIQLVIVGPKGDVTVKTYPISQRRAIEAQLDRMRRAGIAIPPLVGTPSKPKAKAA